jgi:predicted ATPase
MINKKPYIQKVTYEKDSINQTKYPFSIPFLKKLNEIELHKDVTFFIGENGTGKSTLIEGIALGLGLSPEGGNKNFRLETSINTSTLYQHLNFVKSYYKPEDYFFLRAESFYNLATYMDEVNYLKGYGGISLHKQSHGESFLSVLNNKLQGNGLYIFDEPESALSPQGLLQAVALIHKLVQLDSQFIIATHSPILMAYPNAKIFQIDDDGITEVKLQETEHFRTYKLFFQEHEKLINSIIHHVEK